MDAILQIIRDYGAIFSAVVVLASLVVVIIINKKVKRTLFGIRAMKDDTRTQKSKVIVEAFNTIDRMEEIEPSEYKSMADELDRIYNMMFSVVADSKLINAYDKVVKSFILNNKANFSEFEVLARKELGLSPVNNKSKENYLLMIRAEEAKEKNTIEIQKQRQAEEIEATRMAEETARIVEEKRLETEKQKELKLNEKRLEAERQKEIKLKELEKNINHKFKQWN